MCWKIWIVGKEIICYIRDIFWEQSEKKGEDFETAVIVAVLSVINFGTAVSPRSHRTTAPKSLFKSLTMALCV